jgi:aminoglycoside phosphotransferase (APT) family kinase protein
MSIDATRPALSIAEEGATTLDHQLEVLLRHHWADAALKVVNLRRLTGGASRETWAFDVQAGGGDAVPLILRRDPPGTDRPLGMANEAAALQAAARVGVPEPRLLLHGDDTETLGAPYMIMEHVEGETLARRILRDPKYAPARAMLAQQCGEVMARIHTIPRADIPALEEPDPLANIEATLLDFDEPHPVLELGLRWLHAHRPPDDRPRAVVHGDFRHGNLIIGPDGIRAVLDWEIVHWGDPAEDLGWMCVRCWRFGAPGPVGGFGTYEQLLAGYAAGGGPAVDLETVMWWEALGTLRWGLGCMGMARRHLDGVTPSVELAAIGRRTSEQEWDLLELIRR